jgi:hypothetical protein
MTIRLIVLVLMSVIAIGCGATQGEKWETLEDVVRALDKHTLSNKDTKAYAMILASDGASYDVNPGGYTLEFYVYKNKDDTSKGIEALKEIAASFGFDGADIGEVVEGNVVLLAGDLEETQIERLLADLRD